MSQPNYVDITLEIDKESSTLSRPRTVHLRRGETGTTVIRASVEKGGQPFPVDGWTASFCAVMPGTLTVIDDTCEVFGSTVEYEVPGVILNCSGKTDLAYLSFSAYDEDGTERVLTTQAFTISVNPGVDISQQEYQSWTPRIGRIIEEAASSIRAAITASQRAEADLADYRAGAEAARAACTAAAERAESGETGRERAESAREGAEEGRRAAEAARQAAEEQRRAAEGERLAAEEEREASEEDRAVAEVGRQDAEAYRQAKFAEIEQRSRGWLKYWCGEGEYDPETRRPLVAEPDSGTLYHTPSAEQTEDSLWLEWEWDDPNGRWELHGTSTNSVKPITAEQMDAIVAGTDSGEGSEVLYRWGLRYWYAKMRQSFAALLHKHAASDITSGTFGPERIATAAVTAPKLAAGAVSSDKLEQAVREVVARCVRRTYEEDTTLATYHLAATVPSGGVYTHSVAADFSSIGVAVAQINESSSSLVVNSCIVSGTSVLIGVRKLADGTAYAGACRIKLVVLGTPKG